MRSDLTATMLALALAACGCKVAPVDENRADLPYLLEAALHAPLPGEDAGREPGPAARELMKHLPLGASGAREHRPGRAEEDLSEDTVPLPDRWRIGFPAWERGSQSDSPYDMSSPWDPYHQNVLKGDYPLPGTQNTFLSLEATSLSVLETRKVPTPSSVFPRASGVADFFGKGQQQSQSETIFLTADLFQGETAFKPVDWRVLVRGAFNWNHAVARENLALYADPARGADRTDRHAALQQAFGETTIASVSEKYDVIQARLGTQQFNSDFKGFLFFDEALGARVFGNADDNRWQWNAAFFRRWEKDTNSGLNTFDSLKQDVFLVNAYRQDLLQTLLPASASTSWSKGLTAQLSYHHFTDGDSVHYDENDFLVRPRAVGAIAPAHRSVDYLGWNMDGHVGRINVTSSLYHVGGTVSHDEIAGHGVDVDAWMAALELSIDQDWLRFRAFGFYQQGDSDPFDDDANGFDAIFDNPVFAGGEFGFWNRNAIRLTGSGVGLVQRSSLLNSLRSSKDQGAPSYVNPGLILGGVGCDAQVTPHLKLITNASYLRFDHTETLQYVLNQDSIGSEIGYDLSTGVVWRPLLTDNVIVKGGVSALVPGTGFRDIFVADTLYSAFLEVILTW